MPASVHRSGAGGGGWGLEVRMRARGRGGGGRGRGPPQHTFCIVTVFSLLRVIKYLSIDISEFKGIKTCLFYKIWKLQEKNPSLMQQ